MEITTKVNFWYRNETQIRKVLGGLELNRDYFNIGFWAAPGERHEPKHLSVSPATPILGSGKALG